MKKKRPANRPGAEIRRFTGHSSWVGSVAFAPDGRLALSGGGQVPGWIAGKPDYTVRVWDVAGGKPKWCLAGHTDRVMSVAFSPDGRLALSGSFDHTVRLWDLEVGKEMQRLTGHTDRVRGVAFAPDGRHFLSGGQDQTLRLWETASGREVHRFPRQGHWVLGVAFAADGKHVLAGNVDGTVKVWPIAGGAEASAGAGWLGRLRSWLGGRGKTAPAEPMHLASCVAFCPAGKLAVFGSTDKSLRLWDVAGHREGAQFRGHSGGVLGVALAPDGSRLLSGSLDRTLRLWDVATGETVVCLVGHVGDVLCAAFAPDGRTALSGSADHTMRLWRLPATKERKSPESCTS